MKRGSGHVEVILAFVLFVSAIAFALYFLNPSDSNRVVDATMEYTYREIKQATSIWVETYGVKIDNAGVGGLNEIDVNLNGNPNWKGAHTRTLGGEILTTNIAGDGTNWDVFITAGSFPWSDATNMNFIYLDFSDSFENPTTKSHIGPPAAGVTPYYTLGASEKRQLIDETQLILLKNEYKTDFESYVNLKKRFNLPNNADFGFIVKYESGDTLDAINDIPDKAEVFTDSRPIEVVRSKSGSEGKIENANLIVKLW